MCEILAANFNKPARVAGIMPIFQSRAKGNPHGWGFARVERGSPEGDVWSVEKEPVTAVTSERATAIANDPNWVSDVVLGHVRFASQGAHTYLNTHPFERTYRDRNWVFAHNGTLWGLIEPDKLTCPVEGQTDSEQLLCSIITAFERLDLDFYDFEELESILNTFNNDGSMNLVFSDGASVFAYKDKSAAFGLDISPAAPLIADGFLSAADGNDADLEGFVVTTHGLTNHKSWEPIAPGSLLVFSGGKILYGVDQ
jgi:glutamine amidotransferase